MLEIFNFKGETVEQEFLFYNCFNRNIVSIMRTLMNNKKNSKEDKLKLHSSVNYSVDIDCLINKSIPKCR